MNHPRIIDELSRNKEIIITQLSNKPEAEYRFKPTPDHWSMLEVLCHLIDEEVEDFRLRLRLVLNDPVKPLPKFNPVEWVSTRKYQEQDLVGKLQEFSLERQKSIDWLKSLDKPNWQSTHHHPNMGALTAEYFLHNWLAHDYIHIRQLNRIAYTFLKSATSYDLGYAGNF